MVVVSLIFVSLIQSAHTLRVWNVNIHKTVDLPIKTLLVNATTITDNGTCGYDGITAINNVHKESVQNPVMFKSDMFAVLQLPNDTRYLFCGLK